MLSQSRFCHRQKPLDVFKTPSKLDDLYLKTTLQHLIIGFRKTSTLENMDLILSDHHPWTSIYSTTSGEKSGTPIFMTDTGKGNKKHTIIRGSLGAPGGMNEMGIPIAEIDFRGLFSSDVLTLRGDELRVVNRGFMWRSLEFEASDGRQLMFEDRLIALFSGGSNSIFSTKEPATFLIYPEGLPVVEDIITTLVYVTRRRRMAQDSAGNIAG
ncbi:hypothetical protein BDP27DRAFT_1328628 [Rhodocollybia butyracea]|uniref:DUF6593 domain-containing protein n=1 Tax=Rhodocollybia butyracea TaxID=206335 RepID=A0A9P5PQL6_9AGAR|nr:hypothetical protein BDP27DRAFT_1328628 [Rhodocollybia butyracea]